MDSMFPRSTPLRINGKRAKGIKAKSIDSFLKLASVLLKFFYELSIKCYESAAK